MTRDGHVRLLPVHVANKIAAGEVVERPAAVLKELLENALDAGARRIDVTVTAGGRKLVSVRDDGCGMSREDALMSLERQATSKIRDVDDIERIDTLGFRGEAIPSIAAVSRFTLVTRRADAEEATRLCVNAGLVAEVAVCGAPPGTTVEVRDLFCNVPARLKFLRSFATEETHVRDAFVRHALAHPDVGFSLTVDGREIYRFPADATLEERIVALFGRDFADTLVPVAFPFDAADESALRVHGYVELPNRAQNLRHDQFTFVNGRPASAPLIARALRDACPRRDDAARPAAIIFIELPPTSVDVNVHPAKREVRFRRPGDVAQALESALERAFRLPAPEASAAVRQSAAPEAAGVPPAAVSRPPSTGGELHGDGTPAATAAPGPFTAPFQPTIPRGALGGETPTGPTPTAAAPFQTDFPSPAENGASAAADPQSTAGCGPWRKFTYLATTASGYFLLETDAGLVALNPQAAQERIAYEKLIRRDRTGDCASQPLLIPETAQFSPLESARLKAFLPVLEQQGFVLEEFGRDVWKIDAVPALVSGMSAARLLASIVFDVTENGSKRGGSAWREELIAKSLARSFAGASRKFTPEGASRLVEELAHTDMPYLCPRGKPVMIVFTNGELNRRFAR